MRLTYLLTTLIAIFALNLPVAAITTSAESTSTDEQSIQVGDRTRWYRVHLPAGYDPAHGRRYPAVIVLHGAAANFKLIEKVSRMSSLGDAEQFISIYPNGTSILGKGFASWNGGLCCGSPVKKQIDDVGFLNALISRVEAQYAIDPHRVYLAGFSNGGMLAYGAAASLQNKIAALGIVEGSMQGTETPPTKPMPVVIFHGTNDKRVAYTGGLGKFAKFGLPVNDKPVGFAVSYWCRVNHALPTPVETRTADVIKDEYRNAEGKPMVVLYTIVEGKHAWAGGEKSRFWGAKPAQSIDASREMWQFFRMQTR